MVKIENLIKGNVCFSYEAVFKNGKKKYKATSYFGRGIQRVYGNIVLVFPIWRNTSIQSKFCGKEYEAKTGILSMEIIKPIGVKS